MVPFPGVDFVGAKLLHTKHSHVALGILCCLLVWLGVQIFMEAFANKDELSNGCVIPSNRM